MNYWLEKVKQDDENHFNDVLTALVDDYVEHRHTPWTLGIVKLKLSKKLDELIVKMVKGCKVEMILGHKNLGGTLYQIKDYIYAKDYPGRFNPNKQRADIYFAEIIAERLIPMHHEGVELLLDRWQNA